jgi:hypothetical protein
MSGKSTIYHEKPGSGSAGAATFVTFFWRFVANSTFGAIS